MWKVDWRRWRGNGSRTMTTLRNRIKQLEEEQWRRLTEELDGYLAGRSVRTSSSSVFTGSCLKFPYGSIQEH
jgi:hypothetical protein